MMESAGRVIATAVVRVACELAPRAVELRMGIEPHARVHLHHKRVVFVQRQKIADKIFEKRNMTAARDVKLHAAKRLVGPITNRKASEAKASMRLNHELPQRLQTVERAPVVAARHDNALRLHVEH